MTRPVSPRVLVGIIANDSARYSLFTASVLKLDTAGLDVQVEIVIGGDWCGARNTLARMCVDGGFDYLWFMDDDHAFPPNILKQLLRHGQPLVNPICLTRRAPFPPVCYTEKSGPNMYQPIQLTGRAADELVELEAGGCAGMLIRHDVLEAVGSPWFEYTDRSEDIVFCEKAKAAGFKIHADLSVRLGHITTATVWATQDGEGRWLTGINVGSDMLLTVPLATEGAES